MNATVARYAGTAINFLADMMDADMIKILAHHVEEGKYRGRDIYIRQVAGEIKVFEQYGDKEVELVRRE